MNQSNLPTIPRGVNLCCQVWPDVSDDFLVFLSQIGIRYAYCWFTEEQYTFEYLSGFKARLAGKGITLYNVGAVHLAKHRDIILAGPGRDAAIGKFNDALAMLAKVGIHTTTFTWEPDGVWSSDWAFPTRGGALTRKVDMDVLAGKGVNAETRYTQIPIDRQAFADSGLTHGRTYSLEEMWENYEYFIRRVIPAAEEHGIRLALHPNDPPVDSVAGVACLIKSYDDYRRAFSVVESDFLGMEFCCGCYLEAPDRFGDIHAAIREFVARDKIFLVHFRNVDATLPVFVETFIDEGYGDMLELMRAFMDAGYNGTLVMDHSPGMAGGIAAQFGETGFAYGYIKALMRYARAR